MGIANPTYKKYPISKTGYKSLAEFYPFYLGEHSNIVCRRLHVVGSTIGLTVMAYLLLLGYYPLVFLGLIPGYTLAWIGHFVFEKNRPATFKYPLYSFASDMRLIYEVYNGSRKF
ncbi:hypothetical protein AYI68_g5218 [Smittium mucronatum]|uniref:DUF962 domain-containing protein n=1 Tax=Smittium mucronatum TaxID=133383 RepID=A0A1R0GUZ0_9FUNG|nr:hypothetical protein AYI68_g5218 [Smittium mucronatum]